jgi:hypothetical protein
MRASIDLILSVPVTMALAMFLVMPAHAALDKCGRGSSQTVAGAKMGPCNIKCDEAFRECNAANPIEPNSGKLKVAADQSGPKRKCKKGMRCLDEDTGAYARRPGLTSNGPVRTNINPQSVPPSRSLSVPPTTSLMGSPTTSLAVPPTIPPPPPPPPPGPPTAKVSPQNFKPQP